MAFIVLKKAIFIAVISLVLLGTHPSAATCSCSSGGSSSYNFLGDSSFDIDMTSFDEFSRDVYEEIGSRNSASPNRASSADALNNRDEDGEMNLTARINRSINISLDLNESSHVEFVLFPREIGLFGSGDMVRKGGASEKLGAVGTTEESRLIIESVSTGGALYRFDLLESGESVIGDYIKVMENGSTKVGTAIGVVGK